MKTHFLLMLLFSMASSFVTDHAICCANDKEQIAIEAIRKSKGSAGTHLLGISKLTDADAVAKQAKHLKNLEKIWYTGGVTETTDAQLADFEEVPNLKELWLSGNKVTDKGMKSIAAHKNLVYLSVAGDEITDKGIRELTALQNLRTLNISAPKVTPDGFAALITLKGFETLGVAGSKMTDDHFKVFARMTNLKSLNGDYTDARAYALNLSCLRMGKQHFFEKLGI